MAMAIDRARRARRCCSVSLMPGSCFGSYSLIAGSCSYREMTPQRREQSSRHAIDQQHGEQQEQIQNREAEHLFAGGIAPRASPRTRMASATIAPPASTAEGAGITEQPWRNTDRRFDGASDDGKHRHAGARIIVG